VAIRLNALADEGPLFHIFFLVSATLQLFYSLGVALDKRTAHELAMMKLEHWWPLEVVVPTTGLLASNFAVLIAFTAFRDPPARLGLLSVALETSSHLNLL
jgi:non-ribosomal peptide synthetase component F